MQQTSAITGDRMFGRIEHFQFSNLDVQDLNVGKIQQLPELNLHCDALNDNSWFMARISWGITQQYPKSQIF